MDKKKLGQILEGLGSIGPFVEKEVLKEQSILAFAEIPPGDGEPAHQVYIITKDKLIWVYANKEDGFKMYKTYFLNNVLEYEYGKIPAETPGQVAKRAILEIKFMGHSEIGIETTEDQPEAASERHKAIVQGIDDLERQLRKLTKYQRNLNSWSGLKH